MSRKSKKKKSKAPKENGIVMRLGMPELVAIAIPEKKCGSTAPLELGIISFKNNTSSPLPLINLVPELVAPDGQTLKRQEPETQRNSWGLITRGLPVGITLKGRLSWRNNSLQLEIPTNWYHWEAPPIRPENSWTFHGLQPGIYKLRFFCDIPSKEVLSSNPEINQLSELEGISTDRLATHEVNLRLIQPVEHDKGARVQVDGIRFKTLVQQMLNVPKKEPGAKAALRLVGIRITNNTLNPVHFSLYNTLIPEIVGVDGQILFRGYFCDWSRQAEESDFFLAMPGKNITFFPKGGLWWQDNDQFQLIIPSGDGGAYNFQLTLGIYKIQLNYVNMMAIVNVYDQAMNLKQIENIWTGMVTTPFVEFHLSRP